MIEQISLLTVDLIGHISCLLLCTALFRRTCAKRQLVLAFLGTLAAGYLITVVPVIREFPIKAILLVMVFTVFCHACYEGKILTQCLCAVFSYVIMLALDTAAIFLFCNWVGMPREQIFADPQLYMICALFSYIVIFVVSFAIWRFAQSWTKIEKISVSGFLAMLVFPLVSLGTITFLFQVTAKDHSVSHWAIVNALGLVAANAVLMGLLHHIEQEAEERKQNVALQHQFETQLEKTQVLLEAQTAQRKQTHDFKHHLSVLGGLLQEENLAAARQYLAEISETGQLDALAVHSNNPVVDAILNQKYGEGGDPTGVVYMALWKNGAYTSSQQMLNMMASVISNNNPPILHTGAIQGTKRTSYNDTSKWPINISSGHFMSVSGYNLSNATIQVTDPDVTNQQSSSSYSSGKYYINSSVVYSTCDYFAA